MWLVEVIRFRHLKQIVDESLFLCVRKILFKNGELTLYVKQIVISITNLHVYPQIRNMSSLDFMWLLGVFVSIFV